MLRYNFASPEALIEITRRLANFTAPQRQLFARSERVKGIDVHPTEPCTLRFDFSQPRRNNGFPDP
jgi:hypothetical protein